MEGEISGSRCFLDDSSIGALSKCPATPSPHPVPSAQCQSTCGDEQPLANGGLISWESFCLPAPSNRTGFCYLPIHILVDHESRWHVTYMCDLFLFLSLGNQSHLSPVHWSQCSRRDACFSPRTVDPVEC